jgi:anti-sigma regulatory factor (Ser/Thr protein kinase)
MAKTADWLHVTALADEPMSVSEARNFTRSHLVRHSLDWLVEDVGLVASELATNAVKHAHTPFTVTLSAGDGLVLLDVQDGSTSSAVQGAPAVMDMGGRGLALVDALSTDWGSNVGGDGTKTVWASFAASR